MAKEGKIGEAYVDITGKISPLKKALAKAKAMLKTGLTTMTRIAKRLAIGIGVGIAAGLAYATKAAIKQEKAEYALAAALNNTGDATEANMKKFKAFASEIQRTTVYGDEETLMLMAMMKNLGVLTDSLEDATRQSIGMAAATGREIKSMSMYIALAQQGEFTMLRRYIPALRSTTDATEQLKIITDFTARGFKIAQAEILTTSGSLKQMWNAVGDVAEVIGDALLPHVRKLAIRIKDWAQGNQKLIGQKFDKFIKDIIPGLKTAGKFLRKLAEHAALATKAFIALAASMVAVKVAIAGVAITKFTISMVKAIASFKILTVVAYGLSGAMIAVGTAAAIAGVAIGKALAVAVEWYRVSKEAKTRKKVMAAQAAVTPEQKARARQQRKSITDAWLKQKKLLEKRGATPEEDLGGITPVTPAKPKDGVSASFVGIAEMWKTISSGAQKINERILSESEKQTEILKETRDITKTGFEKQGKAWVS